MDALIWVLIAIGIIVIAALMWTWIRRRRTGALRDRFGPEYDRTLEQHGDRRGAEAELRERHDRREQLDIRELTPAAAARYAEEWRTVQGRFVDEPVGAVGDADRLIDSLMRERGYPMDDFDRQAEMISVDHPHIVDEYRRGHRIQLDYDRGEATTEDLRQAMVHYRTLFEELLGTPADAGEAGEPTRSAGSRRTEEVR